MEHAYLDEHARVTRTQFRASTVMALIGWSAVGLIDAQIGGHPANVRVMLALRYGVVAPAIAIAVAWSFVGEAWFRRTHEWVLGATIVWIIGGVGLIMGSVPHPELYRNDQAISGLLVVIVGTGTITGLRFGPTLFALGPVNVVVLGVIARVYPASFVASALWLGIGTGLAATASYLLDSRNRSIWSARRELAAERERSEALLRNVLPERIAERLKDNPGRIAEHYEAATVLFADIVGFTQLSERIPPGELVATLDEIFSRFDHLVERHGLEKIKTIGDAYMVVGGVPRARPDHAHAIVEMALSMRAALDEHRSVGGARLALRIGIASGPVVAGVIGKRKLVYDLWGDTVNTASRMESHGVPGSIQMTEATCELVRDRFAVEPRGSVHVKGKGPMRTWWVTGATVGP